jgi:hypothetical protein
MQVTTLNKVIALFLVGGVVAFLATGLHWEQLEGSLPSSATKESGFWVFFAFLLLPVSALMGAVVEGFSQVTLQNILKKSRSNRKIASLFGQRRAHDCLNKWQDFLTSLVQKDCRYQWLAPVNDSDRWALRSTAADFLLQSARSGKFEWLVQHYATFVLASNLACVVAVAVIYVLVGNLAAAFGVWWPVLAWATMAQIIALLIVGIFALWALCSLSISRYLYSHELSARHMALCLSDERLLKVEE